MTSEAQNPVALDELYQDIILDHFKHPRHSCELAADDILVDEENPTCGDQIKLSASVDDGKVTDVRYHARGCAISTAAASMMSELAIGKSVDEVRSLARDFPAMMRGQKDFDAHGMDDFIALEGVKKYPMRIKCATMCWHALDAALDKLSDDNQ